MKFIKKTFVFINLALLLQCQILDLSFLEGKKAKGPELEAAMLLALAASTLSSGSSSSGSSCSGGTPSGASLADTVTAAPGSGGSGSFDDSQKAANGICGGGNQAGSSDVYSLSASGTRSTLTLEWAGLKVTNGSGVDFVVFENPFYINGNSSTAFMDLIFVEVSRDGTNFCGFAPDFNPGAAESTYSNNPAHWNGFAGRTPVLYNALSNQLSGSDLFEQNKAGGDGYDLSSLSADNSYATGCSAGEVTSIQTNGFVYLRLTSATARNNPDTGAAFVADSASNGPDIDGAIARYTAAR